MIVKAIDIKPDMIARRGGMVLCRNPFRRVVDVSSNAPYAGRTITFDDGDSAYVASDYEFEVSDRRTIPTVLDVVATVFAFYVMASSNN